MDDEYPGCFEQGLKALIERQRREDATTKGYPALDEQARKDRKR